MDDSVARQLEAIVGRGRCLTSPEDLTCYSFDLFSRALPDLVVLPETTDEVSKILALSRLPAPDQRPPLAHCQPRQGKFIRWNFWP